MGLDGYLTIVIVAAMLLVLVFELYQPDAVVFSALGLLLLCGILTPKEALAGFSNPGMLTVAILFIVAFAAQSSGVLALFSSRMLGREHRFTRALLKLMAPVVGISAFLNNTPIVAMFIPAVQEWARKNHFAPSRLLIPLSYAAIFGGICTLIGTSTNLLVNGMFRQQFGETLGMFELAWVGVPCALAGMGLILAFGKRLLPERKGAGAYLEESGREYLFEMRVREESPLVGQTVEAAGLRHLERIFLVEILRDDARLAPVKPTDELVQGDRLIFTGTAEGAIALHQIRGLVPSHGHSTYESLTRKGSGRVIEAVVSGSSPMLGMTIKEGNFRGRYDAVVLAVHRNGERLKKPVGQTRLRAGDTLLLLAGDDFYKRWNRSREFYMISHHADAVKIDSRRSRLVLLSLFGMISLSALGLLDILEAAVLAVIILLLGRAVTVVEARRSLEINVLVVIAASLGISQALQKTGAAELLAGGLVRHLDSLGPVALLAAVYLVTSLLTEVITNNAAAALCFPVAMSAAQQSGYEPRPFVIAIAVAASASFATPIGYQTNLMVYGPGGYRFLDFLRIGVPLNLLYMAMTVTIVPLVWTF